jgi:hypothetical protein
MPHVYRAIKNNKSVVTKLYSNKAIYTLCHHDTLAYLSVDFGLFSRHIERMLCPKSMQVLEKFVQFLRSHFSKIEHFIHSLSCFVTQ